MTIIKALKKGITKINDIWEWVVVHVLVLMCVVMVASIFIQVFARMTTITVIWTSDVATFVFAWLAFLGSAVAVRDNDHFVVDVFPKRWKKLPLNMILNLLAIAAQFIIGYVMLRYGAKYVQSMDLRLSYSLGIKLSYIVVVVPISGALILLGTLERLLRLAEVSQPEEVQNNEQ